MFNFKETTRTWKCPAGNTWTECNDMLKQTHMVIAGTTGSGKSTLIHSIMYSALIHSPAKVQFILIDLKRGIELKRYKELPHIIKFASNEREAINAINLAVDLMEYRYKRLEKSDDTIYSGNDIYIVIDELADLMQTAKAKILDPLSKLMRLGRAARIHVIGATQNPARTSGGGLPSVISQNVTSSVCLHTRSAIESRMIIGVNGGEKLPEHGRGLYWSSKGVREIVIPQTDKDELAARINYWKGK